MSNLHSIPGLLVLYRGPLQVLLNFAVASLGVLKVGQAGFADCNLCTLGRHRDKRGVPVAGTHGFVDEKRPIFCTCVMRSSGQVGRIPIPHEIRTHRIRVRAVTAARAKERGPRGPEVIVQALELQVAPV